MKKILVIGSLNMDIVVGVKTTPRVGETVSGKLLVTNPGGKGANQAVAMGKLGADVTMLGKVGNDSYGVELKDNLAKVMVKDQVKMVDNCPTGTAFIMLNENKDNSIVVIEGANGELSENEVVETWFEGFDYVVLQNEIKEETVRRVIEIAYSLKKKIILNLAPARYISSELLSKIDILVVNETEFEFITGLEYNNETDLKLGFKKLNVGAIIITLGGDGSKYIDCKELISVEAEKVEVVDTTAGGDSFIGGFMYSLSLGKNIEECLKFANKVAGYTVTKLGAQSAMPFYNDICY